MIFAVSSRWPRQADRDTGNDSISDQWHLFDWHRVTLYGDVQEPLEEFDTALGLEIVREA